jgi:hypothetical protein
VCGGGGGAVGFLPSPNSPFSRTGQHGQSAVSAAPERCAVFFVCHPRENIFVIFFFFHFYFHFFFFSIFWEEKWKKKERIFFGFSRPNQAGLLSCVSHTLPDST